MQSPPVAGGDRLDLRPGEESLPAAHAGSGDPPDAPGDTSSSQGGLAEDRAFGSTEHGLHRTSQSHGSSRSRRSGTSNLGHFPTDLTASASPRVAACLLSFCASSRIPTSCAPTATGTRGQASGATLPSTDPCDGCRQNQQTLDSARGARLPLATGFCLRGIQAGGGCRVMSGGEGGKRPQKHCMESLSIIR